MESILRFELDYEGLYGITLKKFNALKDMDEFTKAFHDSNEVREKFFYEINYFLKDEEIIKYLDKHLDKESSGYIRTYCKNNYGSFSIPTLYNNNDLLSDNKIFKKLRESMTFKKLKKLYEDKVLFYILPIPEYYRVELARICYRESSIKTFVSNFIRYLRGLPDEWKYFYLRFLCRDFELLSKEVTKTKVTFRIINIDRFRTSSEYILVHNPYNMSRDELELDYFDREDRVLEKDLQHELYDENDVVFANFFNKAIRNNDFKDLFKYYSVDDIAKKTNYFEIEKMKRGK